MRAQVGEETAALNYSMEHSSLRTENILENAVDADPTMIFEEDDGSLGPSREELTLFATSFDVDKKPLPQKLGQVGGRTDCKRQLGVN